MAIPHWTWPAATGESASADFVDTTDSFGVLSDPTRATILGALFDGDVQLYAPISNSAA